MSERSNTADTQAATAGVRRMSRRLCCENARFQVYLDALAVDGKRVVNDYLVVSPQARTSTGETGVALVPLQAGRIGLLQVFRPAIAAAGWEVPRGFIEARETPEMAALRELWEETGLHCGEEDLYGIGDIYPEPGLTDAHVRLFLARCTQGEHGAEMELGHVRFCWFTPVRVEEMLFDGSIADATSLVCCFRALHFVARENADSVGTIGTDLFGDGRP